MKISHQNEVGRLADQLERAVHGGAWHGPAALEALDGIDATAAVRRTGSSPHTIAGLVHHMRFWMESVRLRIEGAPDVDPAEDWPDEGALSDTAWAHAVAGLEKTHAQLRSVLLDVDDRRLDETMPGSDTTIRGLVLGTLQHVAYHTGQIVQLKRGPAK